MHVLFRVWLSFYQRLLTYFKEEDTDILKAENMDPEIIIKSSHYRRIFKSFRKYYETQKGWYVNDVISLFMQVVLLKLIVRIIHVNHVVGN